jgi:hypothetical protein
MWTIALIVPPCTLAFTIAFYTPTIGIGCRSATVLTYMIFQIALIVVWLVITWPRFKQRFTYWYYAFTAAYYSIALGTLFVTVGGTIMQLVGVYRNCICKAGVRYALPTTSAAAKAVARVELAMDTQQMRDTANLWAWCGGAGIVYVILFCIAGAFYQSRIREECREAIDKA